MGGRCALPLTSHYITMHDRDTPCTCRHSYYALRFLDIRKYRVIMANNQAESTKNFASYTIPEGLDVQCNAYCRLCTVGLRRTKRHCSSQFREYVATNYRPKRRVLGRVSVYSRYSILLSSVQTGPMHADSEWLCIGTKIKS